MQSRKPHLKADVSSWRFAPELSCRHPKTRCGDPQKHIADCPKHTAWTPVNTLRRPPKQPAGTLKIRCWYSPLVPLKTSLVPSRLAAIPPEPLQVPTRYAARSPKPFLIIKMRGKLQKCTRMDKRSTFSSPSRPNLTPSPTSLEIGTCYALRVSP